MHIGAINNFNNTNYYNHTNKKAIAQKPAAAAQPAFGEGGNGNKVLIPTVMALMLIPVTQSCTKATANAYSDVDVNIGCCDTCDRTHDTDTTIVYNDAYYRSPVMDTLNEIFHRLGIDTTGGHVITSMQGTRELGDDNFNLVRAVDSFNVNASSKNRVVYDRQIFGYNEATGNYDRWQGDQRVVYTLTESDKLKGQVFEKDPTSEDDEYNRVAARTFRIGRNDGRIYEYMLGSNAPIGYFIPGDPHTIYWTNDAGTEARVAYFNMKKGEVPIPKKLEE